MFSLYLYGIETDSIIIRLEVCSLGGVLHRSFSAFGGEKKHSVSPYACVYYATIGRATPCLWWIGARAKKAWKEQHKCTKKGWSCYTLSPLMRPLWLCNWLVMYPPLRAHQLSNQCQLPNNIRRCIQKQCGEIFLELLVEVETLLRTQLPPIRFICWV